MNNYFVEPYSPDDIMHFGVKGMKWGVRRSKYYMDDGSLTRYGKLRSQKRSMSPDRYKKLKKQYKEDVNNQYKKIKGGTSLGQKLLYNNATRKRQAEYMVNRKMSEADAAKKAKKDAWRNAAWMLPASAAYGVIAGKYIGERMPVNALQKRRRR